MKYLCYVCKNKKDENEFYASRIKQHTYRCKKCEYKQVHTKYKKYHRIYYENHREKYIEYYRQKAWLNRKKAIETLGGKCRICGETDIRILQVNHINGGGNKELQRLKSWRFYKQIIEGRKKGLEVLCANHNILYEYEVGRRFDGYTDSRPHRHGNKRF